MADQLDQQSEIAAMTRDFRRGMSELAGIIPRIFWLDPPPTAYQIIVVDWLHHEVDDRAEIKMPVLVHIVGHPNIEVFHYLADTRAYRDAQIAASLYGATL